MAPRALQKARQTWEENWGPLSETMSVGIPCRRKTCLTRRSAVSLKDGSLGSAMKCAALEKRSIMVRMVVFPSDVGRPVTKSKAMCDQGRLGMGRGRRSPERGRVEVLFRAQTVQAEINERTSASMVGHQNRRRRKSRVRVIPGWQVSREECAQINTGHPA